MAVEKCPRSLNLSKIWPRYGQNTKKLWNFENMENTLKIKVFRKAILFCTYLRNGSLDLYEIFLVVNCYHVSFGFKFHEDLCTNACTWGVNVSSLKYASCVRVCAWIYTKILPSIIDVLLSHSSIHIWIWFSQGCRACIQPKVSGNMHCP